MFNKKSKNDATGEPLEFGGELISLPETIDAGDIESGVVVAEKKRNIKKNKADSGYSGEIEFDEFPDLAKLMNVPLRELKEEFFLFQVRKLMSKMGKVIVRYNIPNKQLEKVFLNCSTLEMGEILVAPVYIPACANQVNKHDLYHLPVFSLIDFPFGESSVKTKLAEIKGCINEGVDGVNVVIPSVYTTPDLAREFKKQAKKIAKSIRGGAGISVNATDLNEEQLKRAVKMTEKTKLNFITFIFGETTLPTLVEKMAVINSVKGDKKIKVLANVDTAEGVMQLFKLGVDVILTPYADEIGEELIKRFKIKGVKLR